MPDNKARTNDTLSWILSLTIIDCAHAAGTQMLEGVILPLLPDTTGPFACATTGFVLGRMFDSIRSIMCGHTSCPLRDYALGLFKGWVAQFVYQTQPLLIRLVYCTLVSQSLGLLCVVHDAGNYGNCDMVVFTATLEQVSSRKEGRLLS